MDPSASDELARLYERKSTAEALDKIGRQH